MKKVLFLIILIAISGAMVFKSITPAAAAPFTMTVDAATARHIMQSTVQIAMYEYDNGAGVENGGRGLGTVVRHNGRTIIITHDHWTRINPNLHVVEFSNATGRLLVSLNAAEFQSLIQYRDGGTMVLALPAGLEGIIPAALAEPGTIAAGDKVWIARRTPAGTRDSVEVIGAVVDTVTGGSPAYLKMRGSANAAVIPGDSGGGVWANGRLAANLWSNDMVVSEGWFGKFTGFEQVSETNVMNAALNPLAEPAADTSVDGQAAVSPLENKLAAQ